MKTSFLKALALAGLAFGLGATAAVSGPLDDRIKAGEPIRIGFANEIPYAYPGDNNAPEGFVNAFAIGVLNKMGYTDIQPVVTDWGGLIPGLKADRFDIITGGMYILNARCKNVTFSQPMAKVSDAFLVPKGNPEGIGNYADIKKSGVKMVTGAGYNTIGLAKAAGIPESDIMTVPGPTEILAAVQAGRAYAGATTYFTSKVLAEKSDGKLEVSDPGKMPEDTKNWVGIAFRDADADFVKKFDAAAKEYLGSPEMMAAVAPFGYTEAVLPDGHDTQWVCEHR